MYTLIIYRCAYDFHKHSESSTKYGRLKRSKDDAAEDDDVDDEDDDAANVTEPIEKNPNKTVNYFNTLQNVWKLFEGKFKYELYQDIDMYYSYISRLNQNWYSIYSKDK